MKCTRCGKVTDYYYLAGPVILCEECACNSVSSLADEGLFPFFDNVVTIQSGDGASAETAVSESVPAETDIVSEYPASVEAYQQEKAVLSSAYGMIAENT